MKNFPKSFDIKETEGRAKPEKQYDFGMYMDKKWYMLTAKDDIKSDDVVKGLDVSIFKIMYLYRY